MGYWVHRKELDILPCRTQKVLCGVTGSLENSSKNVL